MWKKNFIWWKTSSFLGKIFNGKILKFFRQKWPLFWSKFLYFGYPENISGFWVLNVGFRVLVRFQFSGSGSKKVGLFPRVSGFRVQRPITTANSISRAENISYVNKQIMIALYAHNIIICLKVYFYYLFIKNIEKHLIVRNKWMNIHATSSMYTLHKNQFVHNQDY